MTHQLSKRTALAVAAGVFFVSGAASLIYQSIWIREFSLLLGGTINSMSVVVSTFMAGLAVGSALLGRTADRSTRPIRVYAALEIGILASALLIHFSEGPRLALARTLIETPDLPGTMVARVVLSVLTLGVPCILMGGTLPVMVKHVLAGLPELGSRVGLLYFLNTLGAAVGALATALVLVEKLGLTGTTLVAAGINLFCAVAGWMLGKDAQGAAAAADSPDPVTPDAPAQPAAPPAHGALLATAAVAFFMSGFCSLVLEMSWTRLIMGFVHSGSLSVGLNLGTVLFGFAVGAAVMGPVADRTRTPLLLAGVMFMAVSTLTLLGLTNVELLVLLPNEGFFPSFGQVAAMVGMMLPASVAMGALFPLMLRILVRHAQHVGGELGGFYALNTAGTVLGGLATPFLLIPGMGTSATVMLACGLQWATGAVLCAWAFHQAGYSKGHAGAALLTLAALLMAPSRMDIYHRTLSAQAAVTYPHWSEERAYTEGPDSTVVLYAADEIGRNTQHDNNQFRVRVNASQLVAFDTNETKLMAHLPLMAVPAAVRALVICFGVGNTYRSALSHGIETDVVDINAAIPELARIHQKDPAKTFGNPRGHILINDGRNALQFTRQTYDMITVDPAPPVWGTGMGNIQSREFYELMSARLSDQGVAEAWMLADDPEDFLMNLAAFRSVFPHVAVFVGARYVAYHVLGSRQPIQMSEARLKRWFTDPAIIEDLGETDIGFFTRELVERLYITDEQGVDQVIQGVAPLVDDHPVMEFRAFRGTHLKPYIFPAAVRKPLPFVP